MKIRVIVNPKAGAGAAGQKIPELKRAFLARGVECEVAETRGAGDATRLGRLARTDGVDLLVAVGGDGTLNEVSQSYIDAEGNPLPGPPLGIVPVGTGGDFRRSFDLGKSVNEAVGRILDGAPRPLDLGIVDLTGDDGRPARTTFINIASFGISGRVDRLVNDSPKWMGGRLAFAIGSLRAMATYRNAPVVVRVDGKPWHEGRVVVVAIANGRFFGGGMQIAPRADPMDGLFDVVVMGDMPFAQSLRLQPAIYKGTHLTEPRVFSTRGSVVEAEARGADPVFVDSDGETPGRLPLKARIAKGALQIRI